MCQKSCFAHSKEKCSSTNQIYFNLSQSKLLKPGRITALQIESRIILVFHRIMYTAHCIIARILNGKSQTLQTNEPGTSSALEKKSRLTDGIKKLKKRDSITNRNLAKILSDLCFFSIVTADCKVRRHY